MHERVTTAGIALKDGKVLVAHRVKGGSLSEKWEFPGGKQRWGESDEMTLKREYMEELVWSSHFFRWDHQMIKYVHLWPLFS